jgi:hypothetical protein
VQDVFVDSGRSTLFSQVKIETALAVPVFSGKATTPSFVFCCYSFVRTGSVPFVLKFVQQALRLLWDGLDKVQPHESVGQALWKDVAPADLGEMAADVEMQQHFMIKKRPHNDISSVGQTQNTADSSFDVDFESIEDPSGVPSVRSIYTGSSPVAGPMEAPSPELVSTAAPIKYQTFENIQTHIQEAVRSVGTLKTVHQHVATNAEGSKRAHVFRPVDTLQPLQFGDASAQGQPSSSMDSSMMRKPAPLPMPRPLPLPNQIIVQSTSNSIRAPAAHQPQQVQNQNQTVSVQPGYIPEFHTPETSFSNQSQQHYTQHTNQMGYTHQHSQPQIRQSIGMAQHFNHTYAAHAPASENALPMPNSVASIPTDQISATGISFPVPQNTQPSVINGMHSAYSNVPVAPIPGTMAAASQYCMPANHGTAFPNVNNSGKVRRICETFLPFKCLDSLTTNFFCFVTRPVESKDAATPLWHVGRTVCTTAETECVSITVAQNVHRALLVFALRMVEVVAVPFRVATREQETSSSVQRKFFESSGGHCILTTDHSNRFSFSGTVVVKDANLTTATNLPSAVLACVRLMEVAADARWMGVKSLHNRQQSSV